MGMNFVFISDSISMKPCSRRMILSPRTLDLSPGGPRSTYSTETRPNSNFGSWKRSREKGVAGSHSRMVLIDFDGFISWPIVDSYVISMAIAPIAALQIAAEFMTIIHDWNLLPTFPASFAIPPARLHSSGPDEAALPHSRKFCSVPLLILHPRSRPRPRFRILDSWWENEFLPLIAP